ncbi:hypothetical protein QVE09_09875 [Paenibacillus sp. ClWae2A]|uniref:hypothetical protein n=1 Tax=Paenibacillus sp. ClWae2A TaxID=3057177 RepID=UPI0028F683FE|nr:hypothetical protein [Paenibacillus sp. ClWae2A]MDT9719209.1 hypothetical protein [Paenibacillus sp. ClWae2A]
MRQEDSVFEQIMKQKRLKRIKPETKKLQVLHKKKLAQEQLSELDVQFKQTVAESIDRSALHRRVLGIRRELTEIRRLKNDEHTF